MCVCLHHIIKKEEKVLLLTDIPTPTCTQSHLNEAKAVPLVLTQRWMFFFSTKLRKWGGVHFTGMCFCASVSTHTLHLQGCVLFFFFHTHPAFRSEAGVATFSGGGFTPGAAAVDVWPQALQQNTPDRHLLVEQLHAIHTMFPPIFNLCRGFL